MGMAKLSGWVPVDYDLINEILLDPATFSSLNNMQVAKHLGVSWRLIPIELDPPEHGLYRRILQRWFQPGVIARQDAFIREVAREAIAKFEQDGRCEFISQFAKELPTRVFLSIMGLPAQKAATFLELEDTFTRTGDAVRRKEAALGILAALGELIADRRENPRDDDVVSAILAAQVHDRPLTSDEIIGMVFLLYAAGLDTVLSSSGWHMKYLAEHPDLQRRLRGDPSMIPAAVDDLLRAHGVLATVRLVAKDTVFHGVTMKKGDRVIIAPYLASRDPKKFEDPHVVKPRRGISHLTFSTGPHNCLGAHLARRELVIILEEFLSRFDDIRIPAGDKASWQVDGAWSVTRLPLEWRRIAAGSRPQSETR
jgi:cytochrome P450